MNLDRRYLRLILLLTLPMTPWRGLSAQPQVREVGTQLQLFLDDWLVESMEQVHHVLHSPQPMEVAIRMDRPYEDTLLYDPSVIKDGHRYRMWYRTDLSKPPPLYRLCRELGRHPLGEAGAGTDRLPGFQA